MIGYWVTMNNWLMADLFDSYIKTLRKMSDVESEKLNFTRVKLNLIFSYLINLTKYLPLVFDQTKLTNVT